MGDRLRLARSIRGLSQKELAEIVTVTAPFVSRLEASKAQPSENLLLALCAALDVEPSFFERPVIEEYDVAECSFRHLQSTPRRLLDQALARGTLLHEAVTYLAEHVELPTPNVPYMPAHTVEELEQAADAARDHWDLGRRAPISNTVRVAENAGVVVTRLKGTSAKVDAFSRFGAPPMIVLASLKASTSRDRFNVAHEIGHMIAHRNLETGDTHSEHEAHRFAAAFLLPREAFIDEFRLLPRIDWPHLFELKRRWKVAGSVVLHRATELGLIDSLTARRLYKQYSWKRWHHGEPFEPAAEEPELLKVALEVVERDTSEDLNALAARLGWRGPLAEAITGLQVSAPPPPPNVMRLSDYRS